MFWLRSNSCDEDLYDYLFDNRYSSDTTFFTEFDVIIRCLEKLAAENPDVYNFEGLSYTITKYVPDGKGGLVEYCTWYLNNARELWYFDYENRPGGWTELLDDDLNLPVPFQPGTL